MERDPIGCTLFDTAVGTCGLAWRRDAVVAVQLPEGDATKTRARLLTRLPEAREEKPPRWVARAIAAIQASVAGDKRDLSTIPLDLGQAPPFHRRVYELVRTIPSGSTLSYGEVAERLGSPGAARAVGQAMRNNPCALIVPCHRVLAAQGRLGGFTAAGGGATKLRLLAAEGVTLSTKVASEPLFAGTQRLPFDYLWRVLEIPETVSPSPAPATKGPKSSIRRTSSRKR